MSFKFEQRGFFSPPKKKVWPHKLKELFTWLKSPSNAKEYLNLLFYFFSSFPYHNFFLFKENSSCVPSISTNMETIQKLIFVKCIFLNISTPFLLYLRRIYSATAYVKLDGTNPDAIVKDQKLYLPWCCFIFIKIY